jgi:hypothetical protein
MMNEKVVFAQEYIFYYVGRTHGLKSPSLVW